MGRGEGGGLWRRWVGRASPGLGRLQPDDWTSCKARSHSSWLQREAAGLGWLNRRQGGCRRAERMALSCCRRDQGADAMHAERGLYSRASCLSWARRRCACMHLGIVPRSPLEPTCRAQGVLEHSCVAEERAGALPALSGDDQCTCMRRVGAGLALQLRDLDGVAMCMACLILHSVRAVRYCSGCWAGLLCSAAAAVDCSCSAGQASEVRMESRCEWPRNCRPSLWVSPAARCWAAGPGHASGRRTDAHWSGRAARESRYSFQFRTT